MSNNLRVTEALVEHIVSTNLQKLPKEVIAFTKDVLLDFISCAIGGTKAQGCYELIKFIRIMKSSGKSTVIGYGDRVAAPLAALANGVMGHALDFDDTHDKAVLHTSVCTAPAALALAEYEEVDGKTLIEALAVGMDIQCRLGLACKHGFAKYGWIYTAIMGVFGAAVAASKILDLDFEKTRNAIGIAYSLSSGNAEALIEGTLCKRMQPGFASENGVRASLLARHGIDGPREVLEGRYGFYNVYLRGEWEPSRILDELGERYEVLNLSLKPYPSCRYTHSSIDAMIEFRKMGLRPNDVDRIEIGLNRAAKSIVGEPEDLKYRPRTIVDAQFSIPYTASCAFINGEVNIEDFKEKAIKRKEILDFARRIKLKVDEEIEREDPRGFTIKARLKTKDGKTYDKMVKFPKGSPQNPMSLEDLKRKLVTCSNNSVIKMSEERLKEIIDITTRLERVNDIRRLTELLI